MSHKSLRIFVLAAVGFVLTSLTFGQARAAGFYREYKAPAVKAAEQAVEAFKPQIATWAAWYEKGPCNDGNAAWLVKVGVEVDGQPVVLRQYTVSSWQMVKESGATEFTGCQ